MQPGKALVRPPAQAPLPASPAGVAKKAHPALSAHHHVGVHPVSSWEAGEDLCLSGGLVLVCFHAFGRCEGREGPGRGNLPVLSELGATAAASRPPEPEGCSTTAPEPEAVGPLVPESDVERVV